jgi:hypothetical protein
MNFMCCSGVLIKAACMLFLLGVAVEKISPKWLYLVVGMMAFCMVGHQFMGMNFGKQICQVMKNSCGCCSAPEKVAKK